MAAMASQVATCKMAMGMLLALCVLNGPASALNLSSGRRLLCGFGYKCKQEEAQPTIVVVPAGGTTPTQVAAGATPAPVMMAPAPAPAAPVIAYAQAIAVGPPAQDRAPVPQQVAAGATPAPTPAAGPAAAPVIITIPAPAPSCPYGPLKCKFFGRR